MFLRQKVRDKKCKKDGEDCCIDDIFGNDTPYKNNIRFKDALVWHKILWVTFCERMTNQLNVVCDGDTLNDNETEEKSNNGEETLKTEINLYLR